MKVLIQRVKNAKVRVQDKIVGHINHGILVFLGVAETDTGEEIEYLVDKIIGLRIFSDDEGKMNLSLRDLGYELLVVSQFTLYGNTKKGKRPSFVEAANLNKAEEFYERFIEVARGLGVKVETGQFQAVMDVELVNWGARDIDA